MLPNTSKCFGIYDLYNNLFILSTPSYTNYYQFNNAYLSLHKICNSSDSNNCKGRITILAYFSDGQRLN